MTYEDMLDDLFRIVSQAGARPDVPDEAEGFFTSLVARFSDREECRRYIEDHVFEWFRSFRDLPDWIQGPEWPWVEGKPMVFVGSIDAPCGTFHDDGRFYLFWSPEIGVTRCIIQVS